MVRVRPVRSEEWQRLKQLRLAALRDTPSAFAATYADEASRDDAFWRARAASNAAGTSTQGYLGFVEEEPAGLVVGLALDETRPWRVEVAGMWVAPGARRLGLGGALLEAVRGWATARGATTLELCVLEGNDAARRLYERAGFREHAACEPTQCAGRRQHLMRRAV